MGTLAETLEYWMFWWSSRCQTTVYLALDAFISNKEINRPQIYFSCGAMDIEIFISQFNSCSCWIRLKIRIGSLTAQTERFMSWIEYWNFDLFNKWIKLELVISFIPFFIIGISIIFISFFNFYYVIMLVKKSIPLLMNNDFRYVKWRTRFIY